MMKRVVRLSVGFAFATLLGCSGTDEGRPDDTRPEPQPVNQCEFASGYEFQKILDFDPLPGEMPDETLSDVCVPSPCSLNYNYDVANTPPAPAPAVCPDVQYSSNLSQSQFRGTFVGARCDESEYAMRIAATNLSLCTNAQGRQGWGGSLSLTYAATAAPEERRDASDWDGVSFWAKKASAATRPALTFSAADGYTAGYENIPDPFGGVPRSCDGSGATDVADTEKCDGFGVSVTLSDDWTFIPVRFAAMRQKGFGMPSPVGHLLTEDLVRLQFLISAGDWDIWIDDIAFFRELEP